MKQTYAIDTVALKKAMAENNVNSYLDLAERAKVNRNTVSDIVNAKTKPNLAIMYAIADVLNLTSEQAGQIFFKIVVA